MENKISNNKKVHCRIYYKDRKTNKIGYYETKGPSVSYNYLEKYLRHNNKKFLYITNITRCDNTSIKKAEHEKTQNSMPLGELRERENRISLKTT